MGGARGRITTEIIKILETDKGIKETSVDKAILSITSRVVIQTLTVTMQTKTCMVSETLDNKINASRGQMAAMLKEFSKTSLSHRAVVVSTWQAQYLSMHREVTKLLTLVTTLT